jgi:branched-chain amino acid transport system ATP-binding protein
MIPTPATPALQVDRLSGSYGSVLAVDTVTLTVEQGARHAVIGPNGAGKSTLFNLITGARTASSGRVLLHGVDISRLREPARARAGLAKTFQQASVFLSLSVLDNVALAAQRVAGIGLRMLRPAAGYRTVHRAAMDHLAMAGLFDRRNDPAGALSHGERRQLDLAMALATKPHVLLLDEPTAGMPAPATAQFIQLLVALAPIVTTVIVEHNLDIVFGVATHVTVLHHGAVLADGPPHLVRASAEVRQAYLGDGVVESLFY